MLFKAAKLPLLIYFNLVFTEIRTQGGRYNNAAIGLLVVLQDSGKCAANCNAAAV